MKQAKTKKTKVEKINLGKKGSFTVRKGALHRALGIPTDEKIPQARLESAMHSSDESVRDMARSAKGLEAMKKGKRY